MIELGREAKDVITGFSGIIIAKAEYLFGCTQYGIAPKSIDGKIRDTEWFDEGRVIKIGKGISPVTVKSEEGPGGINRDCPK